MNTINITPKLAALLEELKVMDATAGTDFDFFQDKDYLEAMLHAYKARLDPTIGKYLITWTYVNQREKRFNLDFYHVFPEGITTTTLRAAENEFMEYLKGASGNKGEKFYNLCILNMVLVVK